MSVDGFGREVSCMSALRPGQYVSGTRLVAEAIFRRLTTPRGMLRGGEEEADYGLDLNELVGTANTKALAAALPGRIQNEVEKDERIESAAVTVTATTAGPAAKYVVRIEATTKEGPFTLTVGVDEVTVELLGISTE